MAEKTIYEHTLMGENPLDYQAISSRRVITSVVDINQGSYNGVIRFNTNAFSGLMTAFQEGVVTTPVQISMQAGTGATVSQWSLGLKNWTGNLYDQVEFKLNGVSLITPQVFNNIPCLFVMLASWSVDTLQKLGPSFGFWPDSVGSINYSFAASVNGNGFCNTINYPNTIANLKASASTLASPEVYNDGFYKRQQFINSYNSAGYGGMTGTSTTPGIATANLLQAQKSYVVVTSSTANLATFNLMLSTRLPDLGDVFKKMPLCEVGTLELNLWYNHFNPKITGATTPSITQSASGLQFGNTCPLMVASATVANGNEDLKYAVDTVITMKVGSNIITTGCTLTIPQYELQPEYKAQLLATQSVVTVRYERIYYQSQTNVGPSQAFNTQVIPSVRRPKWLLTVPSATVGIAAPYVPVSEAQSCFDSFPGTTMPLASITQYQVNLGTQPVFSTPQTFEYQQFLNNVSRIEALNGGVSERLNSGLITEFMWSNAMRFYVADLTRVPIENVDVPRSVNCLGVNNSSSAMDLLHFLFYEDEFKIHIATGVIEK
ncbi:MAG: hypothetical protein ACR2IJ_06105 [Fluviibacter sp.]